VGQREFQGTITDGDRNSDREPPFGATEESSTITSRGAQVRAIWDPQVSRKATRLQWEGPSGWHHGHSAGGQPAQPGRDGSVPADGATARHSQCGVQLPSEFVVVLPAGPRRCQDHSLGTGSGVRGKL